MSTSTVGAMPRGGGGGMSPAMIAKETRAKAMKDRPDSKLTPIALTSPSILEPEVLEEDRMEKSRGGKGGKYDDDENTRNGDEQQTTPQQTIIKKLLITLPSLACVASRSTLP